VDEGGGSGSAAGLALGRAARFELVPIDAAPRPFALEPTEPGELVHDLLLGERILFEGRVVDLLTRRPVQGAVLSVESALGAGRLAESDAEGAFTVAVRLPEEARSERHLPMLGAEAPGYLTGSIALAWLARTGVLELVPSGTLEGRVLDGEGRAVMGARLAWIRPMFLQDARLGNLSVPELAPVLSAADGSFRLAGVPCGVDESVLEVVHDSAHFFLENVAPERPSEPRVLELRLGRGRTLVGQLRWEDANLLPRADLQARFAGEPVLSPPAGWTVYLRCADGERSAVSDARGAFRFEQLPAGSVSLSLVSDSAWQWERIGQPFDTPVVGSEAAAAGDSIEQATLFVPLPQRTVRGMLREPDGRGCSAVELGVRLERRARPGEGVLHRARTDGAGAFALEVPDLAFLNATLSLERGPLELCNTAAGPVLDWTLPELVPVELEHESAPAGAYHWLSWEGPKPDEGGRVSSRLRFVQGRVALCLPVGALALTVRAADGTRCEQRVTVRSGPEAQRIALAP
jgi:hypothetical protein